VRRVVDEFDGPRILGGNLPAPWTRLKGLYYGRVKKEGGKDGLNEKSCPALQFVKKSVCQTRGREWPPAS